MTAVLRRARGFAVAVLLAAVPAAAQDLAGHGGPVRALAVLGDTLASAGFDQAIILWDPVAGRARGLTRWHQGAVAALLPLPDGGLASAGEDGRVALWPPGLAAAPRRVLDGATAPLAALAVLPDGTIAAAGFDATIRLYAPDGGVRLLTGHGGPVTALAALPDGRLASAGYDGTLRVWGSDGGHVLFEAGLPLAALRALPDGALAVGGADGTVRLVGRGGAVRALPAGDRPVVALAVAPDGGRLAAATAGGAVALFALPSGALERTLDGPGLPVWAVAFSPDGATLWTGGQDRLVRRWDAATGAALGPLAPAEATPATAADPDGARVFRACAACHALAPGGAPMAGPHLGGLFGRRMGSVAGYAYSPRLAAGDVTWTPATVATLFTAGPDVMLPGTRMPVQTLGDAADLDALLRFLAAATR